MKKILLLLTLLVSVTNCNAQKDDKLSNKALYSTLIDINQKKTNLSEILEANKGKTIVIEIWASWCKDCIQNMAKIKQLQKENRNLVYLFLSCDKTTSTWKDGMSKHYIKGSHYLIPNGMNGKLAEEIELDWIPRYMIINKNSEVVLYKANENDFDKIKKTLKDLKNEN